MLPTKFQRRRLKCEKLTDDRRRTPSDGKTSHCLWQGELTTVCRQTCRSTRTQYSDSEPTSLCSYSLMTRVQRRSSKYQFSILWFDPTWARTHDLPHWRRARNYYAIDVVYQCNQLQTNTTTNIIRNPGPGLRQAQRCSRAKSVV